MNSPTYRLLDANANRAREALRVIEDYARFVLDNAGLCEQLKTLRHDFVEATKPITNVAILHRDTPGDVGTSIKTPSETTRESISDVVTAAGKRLGEALRAIEEFLKTEDVSVASRIESIRYRFYDIERRVSLTLRPAACGFASVRLYVLITESLCRKTWLEVAGEAIAGGADCIQLREKSLESGELLRRAKQLVELCRSHNVICIINDRPDIALLSGADGVHVGQDDLPAAEVRKIVGRDRIVGVSTHNIDQARQALFDSADYIGVGPIYRSQTKPRAIHPGLPFAKQAATELGDRIPAIAIAGIDVGNVDEVLATGIRAIAVSSAIISADNVRAAAGKLKELVSSYHGLPARAE